MTIKNAKDFWSGIMFAALGAFFIYFAQEHHLGTAARMGPAYFPTLLGGALCVLGSIIALLAIAKEPPEGEGKVEKFNWKILSLILGSVLVFSLILEYAGLMLSLAAMIIIASLADKTSKFKETLLMVVVLDVIAYVVFVYAIGMLVPVWPAFLTAA